MYLDTRSLSNSDGTIFKFGGQLGDNLPLSDAHRAHYDLPRVWVCPIDEKK